EAKQQNDIRTILQKLTDYEPDQRSLGHAITSLDETLLDLKLEREEKDKAKIIKAAHSEALKARDDLREIKRGGIERSEALKSRHKEIKRRDSAKKSKQKVNNKQIEDWGSLIEMKRILDDSLGKIDDSAVREFVDTLGVKAFAKKTSKEEIKEEFEK